MPTPAHIATALKRLRARYPSSGALEIGTPYHMASLVIMSARTRDDQVLKLAPRFFRAFPTVHDLARADVATVAATINTIGMYKQKAKNLCAMAQRLVNDFGGKVPSTMDELLPRSTSPRSPSTRMCTALRTVSAG
ncbi:hypothetical protein HYS28_02665 [Candidatus Uhrbacteria bacterium]|nr:hypothetical protein [Candidatus Uhrbacteria bacterium]